MQFANHNADIYIPDGKSLDDALASAHGGALAIGAHQDDLEIFAIDPIGKCRECTEQRFVGVTVTDGGGSPRKGAFADFSDAQMQAARLQEQREAAKLGNYAVQFQLGYPSSAIKATETQPVPPLRDQLVGELREIIRRAQPSVIYAHNVFDKHPTHNAVTVATIEAIRWLEEREKPFAVLGCEVWRGLDWIPDHMKIQCDVTPYLDLQKCLLECHRSQIEGAKGYIEATMGRQFANATFGDPHALDKAEAVALAIDMTPLIRPEGNIRDLALAYLKQFGIELVGSGALDYIDALRWFAGLNPEGRVRVSPTGLAVTQDFGIEATAGEEAAQRALGNEIDLTFIGGASAAEVIAAVEREERRREAERQRDEEEDLSGGPVGMD